MVSAPAQPQNPPDTCLIDLFRLGNFDDRGSSIEALARLGPSALRNEGVRHKLIEILSEGSAPLVRSCTHPTGHGEIPRAFEITGAP